MTARQLEASDPGPGHIENSVCCEAAGPLRVLFALQHFRWKVSEGAAPDDAL